MAGSMHDFDSDEGTPFSSINVTPFVDVVLVLLVIFMITAPALVKDIIDLKLPQAQSGDGAQTETVGVAVNKNGNILINGELSDDEGLKKYAEAKVSENAKAQAIISADESVNYGRVVKVIDILKTAGLEKFAVQIQHEK